ncbi:MAG TPA: hypothetical protein VNZ52_11950, partial [Candidatus Thermoplasmatota archaeon]|nr:hypothetical protein [Candidatus Thermoplasmatota archaeon]
MKTFASLSLGFALVLTLLVPVAAADEPDNPPGNTLVAECTPMYLGLAPLPHACVYGPWGVLACVFVHSANDRELVHLCSVGPQAAAAVGVTSGCVPNSTSPFFCWRVNREEGVCTIMYGHLDPQWSCWQPIPETDSQLPGRYCYENVKTQTEVCIYRDLPGGPCYRIEQSGRTLADSCAPDRAAAAGAPSLDKCTPYA